MIYDESSKYTSTLKKEFDRWSGIGMTSLVSKNK